MGGIYLFKLTFFCISSLICNKRPGIFHACHLKPCKHRNSQHLLEIIHRRCDVSGTFFARARVVRLRKKSHNKRISLELQTTQPVFLMVGHQLDDSKSLHRKMVGNHQTSIKNWLFRVPGGSSGGIRSFSGFSDIFVGM